MAPLSTLTPAKMHTKVQTQKEKSALVTHTPSCFVLSFDHYRSAHSLSQHAVVLRGCLILRGLSRWQISSIDFDFEWLLSGLQESIVKVDLEPINVLMKLVDLHVLVVDLRVTLLQDAVQLIDVLLVALGGQGQLHAFLLQLVLGDFAFFQLDV